MDLSVIILCSGSGTRMNLGYNKMIYKFKDKYIFEHTILKFSKFEQFKQIIVTCSEVDYELFNEVLINYSNVKLVIGSTSRQSSVINGFKQIKKCDYVFVHDGARVNISDNLISKCIKSLESNFECYTVGVKSIDSLKTIESGFITSDVNRDTTINVQTPQYAKYEVFKRIYQEENHEFNDESSLFIKHGYKVSFIEGEYDNFKLTTKDDLRRLNGQL